MATYALLTLYLCISSHVKISQKYKRYYLIKGIGGVKLKYDQQKLSLTLNSRMI